jgi:hypothetical protein
VPSIYRPSDSDSTALPGSNGDGSALIPPSRDAHLLARIFAGQDVTAAEIQSMADKNCALIATTLITVKDNVAQQQVMLKRLLDGAGIDAGLFEAAIFRADPTRPFVESWPEPVRDGLPASEPFPLGAFTRATRGFFAGVATSAGCPVDFPGAFGLGALGVRSGTPPGWNSWRTTRSRPPPSSGPSG